MAIYFATQEGNEAYTLGQLPYRLDEAIYVADVDGEALDDGDVTMFERVTIGRRTNWNAWAARCYALDCAEHVLDARNDVDSVALCRAIEVARLYVGGYATNGWMDSAICSARRVFDRAVGDRRLRCAARATLAALATLRSERPTIIMSEAPGDAVMAAPDRDAERAWQAQRLMVYL